MEGIALFLLKKNIFWPQISIQQYMICFEIKIPRAAIVNKFKIFVAYAYHEIRTLGVIAILKSKKKNLCHWHYR